MARRRRRNAERERPRRRRWFFFADELTRSVGIRGSQAPDLQRRRDAGNEDDEETYWDDLETRQRIAQRAEAAPELFPYELPLIDPNRPSTGTTLWIEEADAEDEAVTLDDYNVSSFLKRDEGNFSVIRNEHRAELTSGRAQTLEVDSSLSRTIEVREPSPDARSAYVGGWAQGRGDSHPSRADRQRSPQREESSTGSITPAAASFTLHGGSHGRHERAGVVAGTPRETDRGSPTTQNARVGQHGGIQVISHRPTLPDTRQAQPTVREPNLAPASMRGTSVKPQVTGRSSTPSPSDAERPRAAATSAPGAHPRGASVPGPATRRR